MSSDNFIDVSDMLAYCPPLSIRTRWVFNINGMDAYLLKKDREFDNYIRNTSLQNNKNKELSITFEDPFCDSAIGYLRMLMTEELSMDKYEYFKIYAIDQLGLICSYRFNRIKIIKYEDLPNIEMNPFSLTFSFYSMILEYPRPDPGPGLAAKKKTVYFPRLRNIFDKIKAR